MVRMALHFTARWQRKDFFCWGPDALFYPVIAAGGSKTGRKALKIAESNDKGEV